MSKGVNFSFVRAFILAPFSIRTLIISCVLVFSLQAAIYRAEASSVPLLILTKLARASGAWV